MRFKITFTGKKVAKKFANNNIHDPIYWDFVHELAEATSPINQWPKQYTVHYLYEYMNRPWLNDQDRLKDAFNWMSYYAPNLNFTPPY